MDDSALRHFYASALLDVGENIKAPAEYLSHADPDRASLGRAAETQVIGRGLHLKSLSF